MLSKLKRWLVYYEPQETTIKNWQIHCDKFKREAPIRYFLNTLYFNILNVADTTKLKIHDKVTGVRKNPHIVNTGLKAEHQTNGTRMLHANFAILVEHIEQTCAERWIWRNPNDAGGLSWLKQNQFLKFESRELGLKQLESELAHLKQYDPEHRHVGLIEEAFVLYYWWKDKYPARKLPELPSFDDQGCLFAPLHEDFDRERADYAAYSTVYEVRETLITAWRAQDQEMLQRLVAIRPILNVD